MRLKILYDSYIFNYQRYGGISRYFVDLMENLPSDFLFEENVKFTDNQAHNLKRSSPDL